MLDWNKYSNKNCQSNSTMGDIEYSNIDDLHAAQLECLNNTACAYVTHQRRREYKNSTIDEKYILCSQNYNVSDLYGTAYVKPGSQPPICK